MSSMNGDDSGDLKEQVRSFWEAESCGVRYASSSDALARVREIEAARYRLIPEIPSFADFESARGKKVLEVGVGAGTDFSQWVKAGANAFGIDLTSEAIRNTEERLSVQELEVPEGHLKTGDAEALPFTDGVFDLVWSWGVLHHSPDTPKAFSEAARVLKPGGTMKAMIYHTHSWMVLFYWTRFALLMGKPFTSPTVIISRHMESPGTKVYSVTEAREMLLRAGLQQIQITPRLCQGDFFDFDLPARYDGKLMRLAQRLLPRWFIRLCGHRWGGMLMIEARKG